MDYEVIDLSAKGPRRGLLNAPECIHPIVPPPSLDLPTVVDASLLVRRSASPYVWQALTMEWQPTWKLAQLAGFAD